jgi:hypothetical protein
MIISLVLFGREIVKVEVGRRFRVVPEGSTLVHLGLLSELAEDDEDDTEEAAPEGRLPFGFSPRGN